jgi:hypothetical protein
MNRWFGDRMRGFRWLWPTITNPSGAENAVNIGVGAALLIAILHAGLTVAGLFNEASASGTDASGMIDASLFALVAWRVSKFSFVWAIAGLVLYLLEVLSGLISSAQDTVGIVTVFIVLAFIGAVRGTYFLRSLKEVQPELATTGDTEGVTDCDLPKT